MEIAIPSPVYEPAMWQRRLSLVSLSVFLLVALAQEPARADAGRSTYFHRREFEKLHKPGKPVWLGGLRRQDLYHNKSHTETVSELAQASAKRRGLSKEQVKLIFETALTHDLDPNRPAGSKPRVPSTVRRLRQDYEGKESLIPGAEDSVLRSRAFQWKQRELTLATTMHLRSEFPQTDKEHWNAEYEARPSPRQRAILRKMRKDHSGFASGETLSPLARYQLALHDLHEKTKDPSSGFTKKDLAFVIQEGAVLSEYADKASVYLTRDFATAYRTVKGLVFEENRVAGKKVFDLKTFAPDTASFIGGLGGRDALATDRALAKHFGVRVEIPGRRDFLKKLPKKMQRRFHSNSLGFRVLRREMAQHGNLKKAERTARRFAKESYKRNSNSKGRLQKVRRTLRRKRVRVTRSLQGWGKRRVKALKARFKGLGKQKATRKTTAKSH